MQVIIEAPFTVKDEARAVINEKLKDLGKYSIDITNAEVYFKVDEAESGDTVIAEVQLHVPGPVIFASAEAPFYLQAFTDAANKSKKQLLKMKDKMANHHG